MTTEDIQALAARYVFRRRQVQIYRMAMRSAERARRVGDASGLVSAFKAAMDASDALARSAGVFSKNEDVNSALIAEVQRIIDATSELQDAPKCDTSKKPTS